MSCVLYVTCFKLSWVTLIILKRFGRVLWLWKCGNGVLWQCGNVVLWQCGNVAWESENIAAVACAPIVAQHVFKSSLRNWSTNRKKWTIEIQKYRKGCISQLLHIYLIRACCSYWIYSWPPPRDYQWNENHGQNKRKIRNICFTSFANQPTWQTLNMMFSISSKLGYCAWTQLRPKYRY